MKQNKIKTRDTHLKEFIHPFKEYFFPEKGWNFGSSFFGSSCLVAFAASCRSKEPSRMSRIVSIAAFFLWGNNSTFCVSLGDRFTFEPKTSFPWDWREELCELDPAEGCPLPRLTGLLSLDPEDETGGGSYFWGFPSNLLPTPQKGLNFGSGSTGASWTENRDRQFVLEEGYPNLLI